jgi:hypothetical protein
MKLRMLTRTSLVALSLVMLLGCFSHSREVIKEKQEPVVVESAPPPPEENPGTPPDSDATWVKGHYTREDGKWVWVPGYWRRP